MSGFEENPFGEPTTDNPFAVSTYIYSTCMLARFKCSICIDVQIIVTKILMTCRVSDNQIIDNHIYTLFS